MVSSLSDYALERGVGFDELSLKEYKTLSPLFESDVYRITVESSIGARDVPGGTAYSRVSKAIAAARAELEEHREPV